MKTRVLFLCTANSARSQMAEAVLRHLANDQFEVFSAGTEPESVDPRTLDVLNAFGISAAGLKAKSVSSIGDQHFDFVISLCDKAHQSCRHWPGSGVVMAWDFPDPKASADPKAFAHILQEITERLRLFVMVNTKHADSLVKSVSPVDFFKGLADETRLLSLLLLDQEGELCVCELMEALELPQTKISRHLSQLRKSGVLLDRRQGQWVFYRIHPLLSDWMCDVLRQTREHSPQLLQLPIQRLNAMNARPSKACATTDKEAV